MLKPLTPLLLFLVSGSAVAEEAMLFGARASGLGGAFTAVADDATAFYWNPAGVARGPFVRLGVFGGESFHDREELLNHLRDPSSAEGSELEGNRAIGFSAGFTVLGVAVTRFTQTVSVLDDTVLRHHGLEVWDLTASFVQSLPPDGLVLGFNLRFLRGTAHAGDEPAADVPSLEMNVSDLMKRALGSPGNVEKEPGVDLGVLYRPREWWRLGFSARNLNRPTFHAENGDAISLEPQVRVGVAFSLPKSFLLAADCDLSQRESEVEQGNWRELAAGMEKSWKEGRWVLRGGFRGELGDQGLTCTGFSGGFAVQLSGVTAELAAMSSTGRRLGSLWLGVTIVR